MFDEAILSRLDPRQFVINTSRGAVVDNPALKRALSRRAIDGAVLDVWEGEPRIDYELLRLVDLGSPHIAGYSLDGKIRGTEMILEELCRFFARPFRWDTSGLYPQPARIRPEEGSSGLRAIRSVVLRAFDIHRVDASLRALESLPSEAAAAAFDRQRNDYPLRPEFRHLSVALDGSNADTSGVLSGLGFSVV
jgi:erythronate-4-phosphate dehydrogenase